MVTKKPTGTSKGSIFYRLAEDIKSSGYVPCRLTGETSLRHAYTTEIAISRETQPKKSVGIKGSIRSLLRVKEPRDILASIWFDNPHKRAKMDNWAMEINGDKNREEMVEMAGHLAEKYGVTIRVTVLIAEKS
jgi:hypothetical protein